MRILFINNLYPPVMLGGYEMRCKETAEELIRRGHNSFILTSRWMHENVPVEENVYRVLYYNPLNEPSFKKDVPDFWRLQRRYYQFKWAFLTRRNYRITNELLTSLKPEVAFIWNMDNMGIKPILAAQDQGIPVVYSLGAYWLLNLKKEICNDTSLIKRKYRSAILGLRSFDQLDLRHVLTNSYTLKLQYVENGFAEENIHVIPRGIPSDLIISHNELHNVSQSHREKVKLLFVGRIVPEKAPDVAIRTLGILVKEKVVLNIVLDIVGAGPEEYISELKELVTVLQLKDHVQFLGMLEHQRVIELYGEYDALIFPSRWVEPFSVTILEAMARGLSVVATNTGGTVEAISEGSNGLLVPPDNPVAMAEAVKKLLSDKEMTQEIRRNALATIRAKYSLECIVEQVEEYLKTAGLLKA